MASTMAILLKVTVPVFCRVQPERDPAKGAAPALTMPIDRGFTKVSIDGQAVDLLVDTGYWDLVVMDGDWYEEKYGKGACGKSHSGCYFCPKITPCVFNANTTAKSGFVGNAAIETIRRTGMLSLDLFLGLSGLPPSLKQSVRNSSVDGSFLEGLIHHNLIHRMSYTLRTETHAQSFDFVSGQLTIGDTVTESKESNYSFFHFPYGSEHSPTLPRTLVSSVAVVDARDGNLSATEKYPRSILTVMDTGANRIHLPHPDLLGIVEGKLRVSLKSNGFRDEQIDLLYRRGDSGSLHIKREALPYLPTLVLQLGDGRKSIPFKIHPRRYCKNIGKRETVILMQQQSGLRVLGTPLFRACSVHVDFGEGKIALMVNPN
ncbi:hypothetical protein FOZ61_006313 [Perkinsus olseni]|uniref:Uncharacterized protein n=1 Tax=Perkinsus olseni TaxID=32597 RepID=A0A7J6MBQ0_PEROL|nr:hypothetical protein FOZ61_006313 [Perkinsus olseni]KAF4668816.1 hypothetical protein FOL46_001779 [Perkinsus olseni]